MRNIAIELDGEERLRRVEADGQVLFDAEKCPDSHAAVLEVRLNNYSGEGYVRITNPVETGHNGF